MHIWSLVFLLMAFVSAGSGSCGPALGAVATAAAKVLFVLLVSLSLVTATAHAMRTPPDSH